MGTTQFASEVSDLNSHAWKARLFRSVCHSQAQAGYGQAVRPIQHRPQILVKTVQIPAANFARVVNLEDGKTAFNTPDRHRLLSKRTRSKSLVFGPRADELVRASETVRMLNAFNVAGRHLSLIAMPSEGLWGKASVELVKAVFQEHVVAMIALDRPSRHLAEQIAVSRSSPWWLSRPIARSRPPTSHGSSACPKALLCSRPSYAFPRPSNRLAA